MLVDAFLVIAALLLAGAVPLLAVLGIQPDGTMPPYVYGVAMLVWWFALYQTGNYRVQAQDSPVAIAARVLLGHFAASLMFLGLLYLISPESSRAQTLVGLAVIPLLLIGCRLIIRCLPDHISARLSTKRTVVIAGTGQAARLVAAVLGSYGRYGLSIAGFVRLDIGDPEHAALEGDLLGTIDDLPDIVRERRVDEVVIATRWYDSQTAAAVDCIQLLLETYPVNIRLAPYYASSAPLGATSETLQSVKLIGLRESVFTPVQYGVKRGFDIAFSLLVLVLTAPLFALIALAVAIDSPGPVVFRQSRIGQYGRKFMIYKFRSMYEHANEIMPHELADKYIKRPDDPRVTRVGRFLRHTSLDELPQFFNVLRGDMSIVGPRPEVLWIANKYEAWQRKRFEVPQGITGWWQVNGRASKPMHNNVEYDLYYIRHYSLWLDFRIIFSTIIAVVTGRGAY